MARALRLAHRGDWRVAPENSLAAMVAALANPACDGLEFDVRASREGIPILLHDDTLDRVQGVPGRPEATSIDELTAFGIPTLAAVLAVVGPRSFLDVELKGAPIPAVLPILEGARGPGLFRAVVSSFEPETLAWIGALRPAWPRWLNTDEPGPEALSLACELGCSGVSAAWARIDESVIRAAGAAGLAIAAWTVRRRSTAERLERLGVAALCVEAAALDG